MRGSPPSSRIAVLDIDGSSIPAVNVTHRQDILGHSLHRNAQPYLDSDQLKASSTRPGDLSSSLATGNGRRTSSSSSGEAQKQCSLAKPRDLKSHAQTSTDRMQGSRDDSQEGPSVPHEPLMALSSSPSSGDVVQHPFTKSQGDRLAFEQPSSLLGSKVEIPAFNSGSLSALGSGANVWGPRSTSATTPVSVGSSSSGSDRLPGIASLDQFLGSPWQGAVTPLDEAPGKPPALPALSIGPSVSTAGSQPPAPAILDGPFRLHAQDSYASSPPSGHFPPPLPSHEPRRAGGATGASPTPWDTREPSFDSNHFTQSSRQLSGIGRSSEVGKQPSYDCAAPSMPFWPGSRSVVDTNQQPQSRSEYAQSEPQPPLDSVQPQQLIDLQQQRSLLSSGMPAYPRAGGTSSVYDAPASLKRKAPFTDSYYPGVPLPSLMQPQRFSSSLHYLDNDSRRTEYNSMEHMRADKAPEEWERRAMSGLPMNTALPESQTQAESLPVGMSDFGAFRSQAGSSTIGYPGQLQQQPLQPNAQQQQRYGLATAPGLVATPSYSTPSGSGTSSVANGSTSTYIPPAAQSTWGRAARPGSVPLRKRGKLQKHVTDLLKAWLLDHALHPYPTDKEKQRLCTATGLTTNQVSNWFINARRRILVPTSNGGFAVSGSAAIQPVTPQQQQEQASQQQAPQPQRQSSSDVSSTGLDYSRENGWR